MSAKRIAEELQKGGLGNGCTVSPPPSGSGKGKGSKKNKSNKKPMTVAETRPTEQADEIIPATVDRDPKGIGVRGLGIAKRLSNEPVPAETQPVQTDPVSTPAPPKLSLKEQILKASQESGVSGIAVAVQYKGIDSKRFGKRCLDTEHREAEFGDAEFQHPVLELADFPRAVRRLAERHDPRVADDRA